MYADFVMELLDAFNALTMLVCSSAIKVLSVKHRGFNFTLVFPFSTKVSIGAHANAYCIPY